MSAELLSDADVDVALASLPQWQRDGDRLCRTYEFDDFVTAFGFMASAALVAERMNHHPEWSNVWNKVEVALSTHDSGGITHLDVELAGHLERLAS